MTIPLRFLEPAKTAIKPAPVAQVHLCVPTYDGRLQAGVFNAIYSASSTPHLKGIQIESNSWLQRNFNAGFAAALNGRSRGITHFCLLHEDVVQFDHDWLPKMVSLMEGNNADVLSAIVPLKSGAGLTSTALDEPIRDLDPHWRVKRLTMHEVYNDFSPTFTHEKLLLNTGLMLIDLRKTWFEDESGLKIWFEFEDKIIKDKEGKYVAVGVPEDWNFSRKARALGASLFATREIRVEHVGNGRFPNTGAWGVQKADQ